MPYWHIIKVEHIRLRTNSSVLCWSFLLFLQCWESRASLDRPRSNAKYFSHGRDCSRPHAHVHIFRVSLGTKKMCVCFGWRSGERSDGEKNIDNCRGWSKQNGRGGTANNWTMKYIHAVHHRTTTRSNRKKNTAEVAERVVEWGVRKKRVHTAQIKRAEMSWLEFFPFPSHSALLYFFSRCSFSSAASRCCTTTLAAQQQHKKSYIFTGRRTTTPERSEHFKPSNRYVNDDRPMMMMISTPTYISSLHWAQSSREEYQVENFALVDMPSWQVFFTFFSLLACTAAVCSSSWPLLIILSTSHKLEEYKLTFIHFYIFCVMRDATINTHSRSCAGVLSCWQYNWYLKRSYRCSLVRCVSKTIRQSRCTIKCWSSSHKREHMLQQEFYMLANEVLTRLDRMEILRVSRCSRASPFNRLSIAAEKREFAIGSRRLVDDMCVHIAMHTPFRDNFPIQWMRCLTPCSVRCQLLIIDFVSSWVLLETLQESTDVSSHEKTNLRLAVVAGGSPKRTRRRRRASGFEYTIKSPIFFPQYKTLCSHCVAWTDNTKKKSKVERKRARATRPGEISTAATESPASNISTRKAKQREITQLKVILVGAKRVRRKMNTERALILYSFIFGTPRRLLILRGLLLFFIVFKFSLVCAMFDCSRDAAWLSSNGLLYCNIAG